jgi:hypothetical protein
MKHYLIVKAGKNSVAVVRIVRGIFPFEISDSQRPSRLTCQPKV